MNRKFARLRNRPRFIDVTLLVILFATIAGCATPPPVCDAVCRDTLRRTDYLEAHADLSDRTRAAICEGRVIVGMSPAEVRAALGEPTQIVGGRPDIVPREQWLYRSPGNSADWVYFQLGTVHSWSGDKKDNN